MINTTISFFKLAKLQNVLIAILAFNTIQGVFPLLLIYTARSIIDNYNSKNLKVLFYSIGIELIVILLTLVASRIGAYLSEYAAENIGYRLRLLISSKATSLDREFFDSPENQEILTMASRETGHRPTSIVNSIGSIISSTVSIILFCSALVYLNPIFIFIVVSSLIPSYLLYKWTSKNIYDSYIESAIHYLKAGYYENLTSDIRYATEIRISGIKKWLLGKVGTELLDIKRIKLSTERRNNYIFGIADSISNLIIYPAMGFGIYLLYTEQKTVGDIVLLIGSVKGLRDTVAGVIGNYSILLGNGMLMQNLNKFFSFPSQIEDKQWSINQPEVFQHADIEHNLIEKKAIPDDPRLITFQNVTFRYPQGSQDILTDFCLTIDMKIKNALIGLNGAGKSTLIKLLLRIYDPQQGCIMLDGIDIREFDLSEYRRIFGCVTQDFIRLDATLMENIIFDTEDSFDQEKYRFATKTAGIDKITKLQDPKIHLGFITGNQGTDLSGGQWQKLAIARGLYRKPRLLIMDEPTASLDAQSEASFFKNIIFDSNIQGTIIVTHRVTSIVHFDNIIVLDGNQVVMDKHLQLLEHSTIYKKLWKESQNLVANAANP